MKIVLCDIDGVVADCTHRLSHLEKTPADWDAFFEACDEDAPLPLMIDFLCGMSASFGIAYVTGRPERIREKTVDWMFKHGLPKGHLFMRKDKDKRQDFKVKLEIFQSFWPRPEIAAVIEDRDQVVEMWRAEGLLCLQPKRGDY